MTYKPIFRWKAVILGCFVLMFFLTAPGVMANPILLSNPWVYVTLLLFIGVVVDVLFGIHIELKNTELIRTDEFIKKIRLNIEDIREAKYMPTYIFGGPNKTLSIYAVSGDKLTTITMSQMAFGNQTADLLSHLTKLNPLIRLDEGAEELLRGNK